MRLSTLKAALVAGAASAAAVALGGPVHAFPKPKYPTTIEEAKKPASSKPDAAGSSTSPRAVDSSAAATSSNAQKPLRSSAPVSSAQLAPIKTPAPAADAKPALAKTAEAKTAEPKLATNGSKTWSVYVVQPHDTLNGVSRRFKTTVKELAELNELDAKAGLKKGLKIKLAPGTVDGGKETYASGPAPVALGGAAPAQGAKARPVEVAAVHDAKPGAAKPALTGTGLAAADKTSSRPGLQIATAPYRPQPKPARDEAVAQTAAPAAAVAMPAPDPTTAPTQTPAPSTTSAPATDVALLGKGKFIWPLKGQVVSKFGAYAPGQRNDGINIASGQGAEVKAAAAGDVIYAGSDKDYGNIVLIKHPDGWATVYAHMQSISVHIRDHVDQGQEIGSVGKSGGVDQAQLHFETRYSPAPKVKHNPVDPLTLLP